MAPLDIQTNGTEPTAAEMAAVQRVAGRLHAKIISLYRRSDGLFAYVIDQGDGEHTGVAIVPQARQTALSLGDAQSMADVDRPQRSKRKKRPGARH